MYAMGNETTCIAQGFLMNWSVVPSIYNGVLALYCLLVLRYGWTEAQMRPYEPIMQAIPPLWGFATSTMGLVLRLFNNANLW